MPFFIHRSDEFLNSLFDFNGDGKITINEMFPLYKSVQFSISDGVKSVEPELYKAIQPSIRDGVDSVEPEPEEEEDDWADVDDWDYESDDDEPFFY